MKKKRPVWLVVIAVILCLSGLSSVGRMDTFGENVFSLVFGIGILIWLLWPLLRKYRPQASRPQESRSVEPAVSDAAVPDKVDYPFTNYGIARALEPQDFIVFDTETTGLSPRDDKIIEIAAIKVKDGTVTRFHSLVNPGRRIPKKSLDVHGITDADVAAAPFFYQLLPSLDAFLDPDLPIVGHNVLFDLRFLWWEFHDAGKDLAPRQFIDTYKLSRKAFPKRESYSLASLIHDYGLIEGEQSHRSESDTEATLALYELCRRQLKK